MDMVFLQTDRWRIVRWCGNDNGDGTAIAMVLSGKIEVCCPSEAVWPFISDPGLIMLWNNRMKKIVPITQGEWGANSRFRMRYEIRGGASNFLGEILEYERPVGMVIHLTGGFLPPHGYLQEIYGLEETKKGTLLKQEIAVYGNWRNSFGSAGLFLAHGMPRSRGKMCLRKLKELAEGAKRH